MVLVLSIIVRYCQFCRIVVRFVSVLVSHSLVGKLTKPVFARRTTRPEYVIYRLESFLVLSIHTYNKIDNVHLAVLFITFLRKNSIQTRYNGLERSSFKFCANKS